MSKDGTIHLVYQRQYYDDEDMDYFFINFTIFRNVPLSQLNRLNNKEFKQKVKEYCDKNYKETATNDTGYSEVNMITGDEYYKTYGDEFGETGLPEDKHFYEDYGQKYDTRQFFKHDFNKEITKFMGGII
tara:strand:+ start:1016 stop:1405 length:390 start_codon:yes stop_codon:yes gene_type:complete